MKRIVILVLAVCFAASWAIAQEAAAPVPGTAPAAAPMILKGDIIDNMCAGANKDNVAEFVKAHTKECALMCASSGYAIVSDGKLYAFDEPCGKQVEEFLKNPESKLQVEVTALNVGDKLIILEIKNQ